MSLRQFLLILRARWKVLFFALLVTIAMAVSMNFVFAPRYTATTTVVIDFKGMDPILGIMLPAQMVPGYMGTQLQIIQSHKVALDVVKRLKLSVNPVARQQWQEETAGRGNIEDWYADLLTKKLDVKPSPNATVVDITFTGADPQFAAVVADTWADAYQKTILELRVDPAKQSAIWFDEQIKRLKANLEEAQGNLNRYQKEKGIAAVDDRLDVENSRLSELSAQLVNAQTAALDAGTRLKQLNDFLARGADPATLPDMLANGLIQSMKATLTQSEARMEQISSQLGANHPEVQKLRADIASQRQKIKDEIANVASGIRNGERIANHREGELRQAVAYQKTKLLQYNESRDELAVRIKEVEAAQRAYETAAQRMTQSNLESQASQTNISVLNRAITPLGPSFPNLLLDVAVAVVLGIFLGINLAVVRELIDRRIRSIDDCKIFLEYPILAEIDGVRVPRRRVRFLPLARRSATMPAAAT